MATVPADLAHWRACVHTGQPTPWDQFGVTFMADGELPQILSPDYTEDDERFSPTVMSNAKNLGHTGNLVVWAVDDPDGGAFGYRRGHDEVALDAATIVRLDDQAVFRPVPGRTLSEALCVAYGQMDPSFEDLAAACRAGGVPIIAQHAAQVPEPARG